MTLSPSEDRRIKGVEGSKYELNKACPIAGCGDTRGLERHHMWRKSDVIGDFWWVETSDGALFGNCIKLCGHHHREVTDNIARITLDAQGVFHWRDLTMGELDLLWQPPTWLEANFLSLVDEPTHTHDGVSAGDVCPTCLRKVPVKVEKDPDEPKVRKTWSVAVPLERLEDGADVIDALLDAAQEELHKGGIAYGEGKKVKYFILTTALGLFVQHGAQIMSDS